MGKKKNIGPPGHFDATKMCWWCKHFYYSCGDRGYSEMTPGYDMTMECRKGYWKFESTEDSEESFRNKISHAVDCEDFESKLLDELVNKPKT